MLATVPDDVFAQLLAPALAAEVGEDYLARAASIEYFAALCLLLELDRGFSPYYWTNVADRALPFVGLIEHTNFVEPARYGGRITTRAVEFDGVELPAGARLLLLWLAAGRDPRRWEDPDRYDVTRKVTGHIGLGFGIHACVGQALARMLADGPTFAHGMTKKLLHQEWAMDLATALEAEAQAQAICMQTADFRRAHAAFVAKIPPRFEGN